MVLSDLRKDNFDLMTFAFQKNTVPWNMDFRFVIFNHVVLQACKLYHVMPIF